MVITVQVTKKDLTRKIDRVDISLDETQQIIEGTRDEVGTVLPQNLCLSGFDAF